ncbi:MAG: peptidyl-prolyl cis-trans isomerase [Deltaproteobacteria bacterium]|nr:peptidyl-prolyl cis-trans isomerase [Deltaproteobacteria bacterium]
MAVRWLGLTGIVLATACEPARPAEPVCLSPPPGVGPAIAQIGDVSLTVTEVVKRLRDQGTAALRRYDDKQRLRQFVDDQVRFELLARAAQERGLARDPEVVDAARKVMVRRLLQRDLGNGAGTDADAVSDAAILEYYRQHMNDYQQPEMVRIAHIQLAPTDDGRARGRALIVKLNAKAADRALFARLVAQSSLDADSVPRAGELTFMSREQLTETLGLSFAGDVFALAAGSLAAEPVQSIRGWHVVRMLARREALVRGLDEVKGEIRDKLMKNQRAKAFDGYLAEIRRRFPVAVYEEHLDEIAAQLKTPEANSP